MSASPEVIAALVAALAGLVALIQEVIKLVSALTST